MNTLRISSSLYCRAHKLTLRHFRISSSPLAENPLGSELTDVEKREYEIAKKERDIRAAREKKLKEAKTPLAKWIRHDDTLADRERIKSMTDKIRQLYPDKAQAADQFLNSLDMGVILQQAQKLYPEFGQKSLNDEEVFDTLSQFLEEKDLDPTLAKARQRMGEESKAANEQRKANQSKMDKLGAIMSKDFPGIFDPASDSTLFRDDRLAIDDKDALEFSEQNLQEVYEELLHPKNIGLISREDFFSGVDKSSLDQVREREFHWAKYQSLIAAAQTQKPVTPAKAEKSVDDEPVIEAAGNFDRLFSPSSLGKYIRWNEREQKKYLPEGWGGKIERREFELTKESSLLLRQDTLTAIQKLDRARAASFTRSSPRPILLTGERGVGKSAILQQVVYWARKSDWLVFNIKSGLKWTQSGGIIQKSKLIPGCWDQPNLAAVMLSYFLEAHADKLRTIPLRTAPKAGNFEGKTLYDLVEYGASLKEYAADALVLVRNELTRVIEHPVLIAIDDYNELYNYSQTWRNPESTRFKPEKIQNRQLTLTNIFMESHKDPRLINGTFIGALSEELTLRHFDLEKERGDNTDWIDVKPYSLDELNRVMAHYKRTKTIFAETSTGTHAVLHQLTMGNGREINKWSIGI